MKGLLFGVFDLLHEGHKYFISEAERHCDALVVAVAPDSVVKRFKGKEPKQTLEERMHAIAEWNQGVDVRAGDERPGSWKVVMEEKPDVIFLGYDQEALRAELQGFGIRIVTIDPHEPKRFKSSLL